MSFGAGMESRVRQKVAFDYQSSHNGTEYKEPNEAEGSALAAAAFVAVVTAPVWGLLALAGCSSDKSLPPLPGVIEDTTPEESGQDVDVKEDTELDNYIEMTSELDELEAGDIEHDAELKEYYDVSEQLDQLEAGETQEVQGEIDTNDTGTVLPQTKYQCLVTAQDCYGMKYGMMMGSTDLTGLMRFKATAGTDPVLELERQTEPASSWLKDGASIPSFAEGLNGNYEIKVNFEDGVLTCLNIGSDATFFPMTWFDDLTSQPEPIGFYAKNEVYIAVTPAIEFPIECDNPKCSAFSSGADYVDVNDTWVKDTINAGCEDSNVPLTIECEEVTE